MNKFVKLFSIPNPPALAPPASGETVTLVYTPASVGSPFSVLTFDGHDTATPVDGIARGAERSWVLNRAALENALNRASGAITGYSSGAGHLILEGADGVRFEFGATAGAPKPSAPVDVTTPPPPDEADPRSAEMRQHILHTLALGSLTAYADHGIPTFTVSACGRVVTFLLDLTCTWVRVLHAGVNTTRAYPRLAYDDYNQVRFAAQDRWHNQQKA